MEIRERPNGEGSTGGTCAFEPSGGHGWMMLTSIYLHRDSVDGGAQMRAQVGLHPPVSGVLAFAGTLLTQPGVLAKGKSGSSVRGHSGSPSCPNRDDKAV